MRAWAAVFGVMAGCTLVTDPNVGRYSCTTTSDCGDAFECVTQFEGGGRCFRVGECVAERCNATDDDCDGRADNGFDLLTDSANCGACDRACSSGASCRAGACAETNCGDGLDNDGNGRVDCADEACLRQACGLERRCRFGGVDGGTADAGLSLDGGVRACLLAETTCDNGVDDDADGETDCRDDDCGDQSCGSGRRCRGLQCAP